MSINLESLKKILQLDRLTETQKQVVFCKKTPILVSASAGSGKTFALCCRILFKLLDHNQRTDASDLLIVSFTKAAANEIFNRLKNKIINIVQQFPDEQYFKKQLNIITIRYYR